MDFSFRSQISEDSWLLPSNYSNDLTIICEEIQVRSLQSSAEGEGADSTPDRILPPTKRRRLTVSCAYCGRSFGENKSLYRHQRTSRYCKPGELSKENYPCSYCGKVFSRADVCQRHENEVHQGSCRRTRGHTEPQTSSSSDEDWLIERAASQAVVLHSDNDSGPKRLVIMNQTHENDGQQTVQHTLHGQDPMEQSSNLARPIELAGHTSAPEYTELARSNTNMDPPNSLVNLPVRSRSALERLGASPGYISKTNVPPCPACRKPFGTDKIKVVTHIQIHLQQFQSGFECTECDIEFQSQENLEFHLLSASNGSCGFIGFDHVCTGHHPPNRSGESGELTEHEHLMLRSFLRHWEQAQLDALIIGIDDLTTNESPSATQRWSWSRARAPPSTTRSSSVIPPSFRSEPKHVNGKPRTTIQFIEQKLASLSSIGPSALIRRRAAENTSVLRLNRLNDSLYQAIEEGDVARVKELLENGADANVRPSHTRSLQMSFLTHRDRYPGYNPVHTHSQALAPLALATILGRLEIASVLVKYGADSTLSSNADLGVIDLTGLAMLFRPPGLTPPILSRYAINTELPSKARSKRGDLNRLNTSAIKDFLEFIANPTSSRMCTSELAELLIGTNYSLGLQTILDLGVDPNSVLGHDAMPLLQYAIERGAGESALVLIEYGARCSPEEISSVASTILKIVDRLAASGCRNASNHILGRLVRSFPETHQASARSFLLGQAVELYDPKTIRLILDDSEIRKGTWFVASQDENLGTSEIRALRRHEKFGPPISFASYKGRSEVVKMFLELGAPVNGGGGIYGSALCNAIINGHMNVIKILLDAGADPNYSGSCQEPPLLCAARCNRADIASDLVKKGADPNQHGAAFIFAVRGDNFTMAKFLLKTGMDINFNSEQYGTALCAVLSRSPSPFDYLPMVKFLLENGADPTVSGPFGDALEVAISLQNRLGGAQVGVPMRASIREVDMVIDLLKKAAKRC